MDTAPSQDAGTPTASNVVSLWQTNSRALLAERSFSVKAVRPSAYFHFTGVAIGEELVVRQEKAANLMSTLVSRSEMPLRQ